MLPELEAMRAGVLDVVTQEDLAMLTADDMQLLCTGTGGFVTVAALRKVTNFKDERSEHLKTSAPERMGEFEAVFWSAIEAMSELDLMLVLDAIVGSSVHVAELNISFKDPGSLSDAVFVHVCLSQLDMSDDVYTTGTSDGLRQCLVLACQLAVPVGYTHA